MRRMTSDSSIRIGHRVFWVVPLLLYLVASLAFFSHGIAPGLVFQPQGDSGAFIWFLNWWPFALSHHINPFVSFYVWSPIGFNMLWATSVPTLSLLAAPITLKFGPATSWNLLSLMAPILNSFAMYYLLRYITKDRTASLVGGYLFGFSSYVLGQLLGHLNLAFVPLIPVFTLLALRRANRDIGRVAFVALTSLAAILQFGISMELLATATFVGSLAGLLFFLPFKNTLDLKGLAKDTAVSGLITIIVLAPAIYYLIVGYGQVPDVINSATAFSADLLNFIVPTPITRIGGSVFSHVSGKFTGNFSEQGAYLGIPLLIAAFLAVYANRRAKWMRPILLVLLFTMLFSLGPTLWISGNDTTIPLPWQLLVHVPLLAHALPVRFAVYTVLIVSVLVTLWLSDASVGRVGKAGRYCFFVVAAVFLMPNAGFYLFGKIATPDLLSQGRLSDVIGHNKTAIVLPYGHLGNSMYWQVSSNMTFRMTGGYLGFVPRYFSRFPATSYLYGRELPVSRERFKNAIYAFCVIHDVGGIVITPGTNPRLAAYLERLPWERVTENSILILKVPEHSKLN